MVGRLHDETGVWRSMPANQLFVSQRDDVSSGGQVCGLSKLLQLNVMRVDRYSTAN